MPRDVVQHGQLASFLAGLAREHGPIFTMLAEFGPFAGRRVVYLVGPDAHRFVFLTHHDLFSHDFGWTPVFGDVVGHGLINMDPPEHQRYRGVLAPAFTAAYMNHYVSLIRQVVDGRIANWSRRGEVDLTVETREITFDAAARAFVGLKPGPATDELRERFYSLVHGMRSAVGTREPPGAWRARVRSELDTMLLDAVEQRRPTVAGTPPTSALDMLLLARDAEGRPLSDEQLLGHINTLLVAGYETTTNLAAWLLYFLARDEAYRMRVRAEIALAIDATHGASAGETVRGLPVLTNAIREVGRLHPPVMLVPRVALAEFEFAGCTVQAGSPVFVAVAATHRLPEIFANPDAFEPDRFAPPRDEDKRHPTALATFGAGPRTCLGIGFAMMEAKLLAMQVLPRYDLTPVPGRQVTQIDNIIECLPDGIWVRVSEVGAEVGGRTVALGGAG